MKNKRLKIFLIFIFSILGFIFLFWLIVIPESLITDMIESSIKGENVRIGIEGFKKGLFYNFRIGKILLNSSNDTLVSIEDISGRINLLFFFIMRLNISFHGNIGNGVILGNINLSRNKNHISLNINSVNIDNAPLLRVIGIEGKGVLSGEFRLKNSQGDLKFFIRDAQLKNTSFSGFPAPFSFFNSIEGAMVIKGDLIEINSISFEGKDIYARAKGSVQGNNLDIKLELMLEASFTGESYIFTLLSNYKISPKYYVIPIKTRISI
ncbi:MAG: type II secretion system protein GspN [Nitrospirota bacterium]